MGPWTRVAHIRSPKCLGVLGPAFTTYERYLIRPNLVNRCKCLNSITSKAIGMLGLFVLIPEDRSASLRVNERNVFRGPNLPPICRSNDHRLYERVDLLATFRICRASSEPGPEVQDSDVLSEQVNVRPVNRQGGATVVRFMYFLVGRHNCFTPPQTGGESSYKDRLSIEQLPERPHIVSVPGSLELTRDRFQIRTVRHSFLTQIGCFGLLSHSDQ
jgi:hypothetical protein